MSSVGIAPIAADHEPRCAGSVTTPNCFGGCAPAVDAVASCAASSPIVSAIVRKRERRRVVTSSAVPRCSSPSATPFEHEDPHRAPVDALAVLLVAAVDAGRVAPHL